MNSATNDTQPAVQTVRSGHEHGMGGGDGRRWRALARVDRILAQWTEQERAAMDPPDARGIAFMEQVRRNLCAALAGACG